MEIPASQGNGGQAIGPGARCHEVVYKRVRVAGFVVEDDGVEARLHTQCLLLHFGGSRI